MSVRTNTMNIAPTWTFRTVGSNMRLIALRAHLRSTNGGLLALVARNLTYNTPPYEELWPMRVTLDCFDNVYFEAVGKDDRQRLLAYLLSDITVDGKIDLHRKLDERDQAAIEEWRAWETQRWEQWKKSRTESAQSVVSK